MAHLARVLASLALVQASCVDDSEERFDNDGQYAVSDASDPSAELYATANLPRFDLEIPSTGIEALEREPRTYTEARLSYRGETVDVAVRLKGEYSYRPIGDKPAFKLRFDKLDPTGQFRGLRGMTLNNNIQDPTMLSQVLGYRMYRSVGVVAPRATLALVFVNGEYRGVYTNVESEDSTFIGRHFADASGNLYEEGGVDFEPGNADFFDLETNKDIDDRTDLEALIAAVDTATPETFIGEVGAHLDIEAFLTFAATEAVIGGVDGYAYGLGSRNNFRIYHNRQNGLFYFIPWGLDRALRPRFDPALVHSWFEPPEMFPSIWDVRGLILTRCLESPECYQRFVQSVDEVLASFESLELGPLATAISERVDEAIVADPGMEADLDYVVYATELMQQFIAGRPTSVRQEL